LWSFGIGSDKTKRGIGILLINFLEHRLEADATSFVIRISSFFRHSSFVLRISSTGGMHTTLTTNPDPLVG